jgi:Fe-S-cluster containining protein
MNTEVESIKEINNLVKGSGRIEQIYLVVDRTVKLAKKINPESYCISCPITCCINDLYLPVTFLEWKSIEAYLNKKTDESLKEQIRENLAKIPADLFNIENDLNKFKGKSCPLLINNKCSIAPYRPLSCRTYGMFHQEGNNQEAIACSMESDRRHTESKNNLLALTDIKNTLTHLNRNKPAKLLISWLQEYFRGTE